MPLLFIARVTGRACAFALTVCALWYGVCAILKRPRPRLGFLIRVFYLCAVVEIIGLRGLQMASVRPSIQLIPFFSIASTFRQGPWPFLYNTLGNLLWFVPVGLFLRKKPRYISLLAGFLLSLTAETLQYLLSTGLPDVDDLLLNSLGALLGRLLSGLIPPKKEDSP